MTRIAIFASGTGSNAAKIIEYFKGHQSISIALIVSNKSDAGVLKIAASAGIPTLIIEKERFFRGDAYLPVLHDCRIGFVVLAGFLWKVPSRLIKAFPSSIINIHPALLPAYGGKGMYGANVHRAIVEAGEKTSGITIHFVDEHYDNGDVIFQERYTLQPDETPETLAQKIHELEHEHFPRVIEQVVSLQNQR